MALGVILPCSFYLIKPSWPYGPGDPPTLTKPIKGYSFLGGKRGVLGRN